MRKSKLEIKIEQLEHVVANLPKERRKVIEQLITNLHIVSNKGYASVSEASKLLHLSDSCVRKWIQNSLIKAKRFGGRWRIPQSELEKFFD